MAPKLLTDCPENLREAIDWLVQVQHCGGVSTVSDALSTLFDNVAQDAEKSLPSLPDPDRPSARDVVSKLRAFQSTLPKDSENPNKNIIHNLCASAGSLLGHRSPGTYDGSGIVYGNASRLCDAILAFLYAVFSDVHGNQPYVAGRSVLHDVVVELKSQLWRGHKGFYQVIPRVANGLQRYNSAVKASNDRVKEPIETVLEYVKPDGELRKGINDLQITETSTPAEDEQTVESAVSLVERCKEVARAFSKSLTAAKDAIDDLNPKLKRKLENARRSFFNHVDWLSRWSKKGQKKRLDKMVQKIKTGLKRLAKAVKDKIKQEVHTVVELLKKRVREMRMKLEGITASLEKYVKELGQWMGEAKKYINAVKEYVDEIMKQLDGENKKKIDEAAAEIDSQLGKKVEALNQWIKDADAAVNVAKQKAEDVFKRLDKNSGTTIGKGIDKINEAKDAVTQVSSHLQTVHTDLDNWKNAAQGVLTSAAGKADEVHKQLDPEKSDTIGKNLKDINASNEDVKKANEQLKSQVVKLNTWIIDADRIREQAQQKAQDVYNSLKVHEQLSDKIKEIQTANQTIENVNKELNSVDEKLGQWSQEAGKVIQDVVKKAEEVYDKLSKDEDKLIGQGIKHIEDAKQNVVEVGNRLKSVNDDLRKWRKAAETVLKTAVDKASEVHKQLDPEKGKSTLGNEIDKIDTARQGIVDANKELERQVKSLNEWIESAEKIRAAAENKAKEAYNKLNVHEELSKNVDKIVKAKEKITLVHSAVDAKVRELGTWKDQAEKVLEGAIKKAEEVNKGLDEKVHKKIGEIEKDNEGIKTASTKLAGEVEALGKWMEAAGKVIDQADEKCDEILKRVDINHKDNEGGKKGPVILTEASKLKEQGTKLLKAAEVAKQTVESKVKDALDAVKNMDCALKKDLKVVKDEIKKGITEVIKDLGVDKLGEKVKEDLKELRGNIEGLKNKVDERNDGSLVKKELDKLDEAKQSLTEKTSKIKEQTEEMNKKFKETIKDPLDRNVKAVEDAIEKLYGKINPGDRATAVDKKQLHKIFERIKEKVAVIKGNAGRGTQNNGAKGLEGIVSKVRVLAETYRGGSQFWHKVNGFVLEISRENMIVREMLEKYAKEKSLKDDYKSPTSGKRDSPFNTDIAEAFQTHLKTEADAAGQKAADKIREAERSVEKIQGYITAVNEGLTTFVDEVEKKLKVTDIHNLENSIDNRVDTIFNSIANDVKSKGQPSQTTNSEDLKLAVKRIFMKLIVIVRKVAKEVKYLGIDVFGAMLDSIKPTVDDLNTKLTNAAKTGTRDPGTANAVDDAIGKVKDEVNGLDKKFKEVKKPVDEAVKTLDAVVKDYDGKAREQLKEAAKVAIDQAAKQISKSGGGIQIDLKTKMPSFHTAHKEVTNKLKPQLEALLNEHIGKDDPSSPSGVTAGSSVNSQPNRVTLADGVFKNYRTQITQPVDSSTDPTGNVPKAINSIKSDGLKGLNIIGDSGGVINTQSFADPIKQIESQLEGITKLVSQNGGLRNNDKGVKILLDDLRNGLDSRKLNGAFERGLGDITKIFNDLQKNTFRPKPEAISQAVEEIRNEVEELRKKLQNDKGDDVLMTLKDLKETGLGINNDWQPNGKDPKISGIGKIRTDLEEQNKQLPKLTDEMDDAFNEIKRELMGVLGQVGMRLDNIFVRGDVMDNLRELNVKIGKGQKIGLERIHALIETLQERSFKSEPEAIEKAKVKITEELTKLQKVLHGDKERDVIQALKDLRDVGLGADEWVKEKNTKGHEKIEKELKGQEQSLTQQPEKITTSVDLITKELDSLRTALQNNNGHPKDDVISRLVELLTKGLGEGDWQNGKHGLGKIRSNVQEQSKQLSQTSERIEKATQSVMDLTKTVLQSSQQKLSDGVAEDDILDSLKLLAGKIGKDGAVEDSLQGIKSKIGELQSQALIDYSSNIKQAKEEVDKELRKLQGNLKNEVSSKLTDLVEKGLGGDENWNGKNAKGFDHIKNHLQSQQSELSKQPGHIALGMKDITDELQSLRTVLQGTADDEPQDRGVIRNLAHLVTQIGTHDDEGLKKIKSDMDSVKKSQVPVITENLNTISTEITNAAGQLGLNLNQLENPHIDGKLKGIQDGLDNLRLTDLAAAIKMCDDFLIKADDIEKNTIDALWKHVDVEVDDAIKDLTKEARTLYVDSVKEALQLFAKKVEEDLEQLPNEINRDRYVGYKGFMKYLQGPLNSDLTGDEQSVAELSSAFQEVFEQMEKYVAGEITRLHYEQNKEQNPVSPPTDEPYTPKLNDVYEALTDLLVYLRDNEAGTDRLTELVERLTRALGNLVPSDFKHPSTPLLDTVSIGLTKFAGEFSNTYISAYSGQRCREEHAHKYAKVLLSMIPMTHKALSKLMMKCENEWKHLHITKFTADDRDNPLGNYLTRCGYMVSSNESGQDGELNNMFTGGGIKELLTTRIEDVGIEMHLDREPITNGINLVTVVAFLYNVLCQYFQVCHIPVPPEPRYPCTVRDMLSWLSGLQYTQVADKLPDHCKALLNRRCHDGDTPNKDDPVMAKCIGELPYAIAATCSNSTALLTAIQGNGHGIDFAAYPYSVDFSNNRAGLHYPADPAELLDMLRDIVCRLSKVLYFLYSQCCRSTARVKGWRECTYGRQVQSHNWQCQQIGTYSSTISTTTATITSSTTTHGCPLTSPLQSFLSDCCHGLLPHTLTAADMAIECANCTANLPGQQCLTPLGFWDLGFAASISGTGWDLVKRLGDMCRDADACLFVLCRTLSLLCPTAPSSLADVFALYAQVLRQWDPHDRVNHRDGTYTDASDFISHLNTDGIDGLFPMWTVLHGSYESNKLTTAIASLTDHDHESHDALSSLFHHSTCQSPRGCAPYLQPLGLHAHHTYPRKHAGLYITWIMHLAWQFWELLQHLLQALDNIDCTASGCATCPCQPGTHGEKDTCYCPSIIQCAGPLPTLYRYGFTYRNANLLVTANRTMRCGDLNTQLKEALHSDHFTELFRQIDQLMWHIRMPFLYFLIALWTVVALYILHTFLYRLDIFHIRSHLLTTKASHFIDVKALLIPNRKMLSLYDASYFDDDPSELLNFI